MPIDPGAINWDAAPPAGPRVIARTPPMPKAPVGYKPGPTLSIDPGYRQGEVGLAAAQAAARAAVDAGKEKQIIDYRNSAERSQTKALNDINMNAPGAHFDRAEKLRDDFRQSKEAANYTTTLPLVSAAMHAPDNGAGDLQTIYAFGKVMDPGSAVREGELEMAGNTAPLSAWAERFGLRLTKGNRLRPEDRRNLIETMRRQASQYGDAYTQARYRYADIAKQAGIRPLDVIGPHAGIPFQQTEANFLGRPIHNRDGTTGAKPTRQQGPMRVTGDADYAHVPSGSLYLAPDGTTRRKR